MYALPTYPTQCAGPIIAHSCVALPTLLVLCPPTLHSTSAQVIVTLVQLHRFLDYNIKTSDGRVQKQEANYKEHKLQCTVLTEEGESIAANYTRCIVRFTAQS